MSARLLLLACLAALLLGACGEREKPVTYKQGDYQGKPDTAPWANERYKNDKAAWENDIRARNQKQNEYARMR
jgi:major membrane immunogen (membrane-anchored lipoprotein)